MQLSASMCKFSDYLYMRQVYRVQTLGSAAKIKVSKLSHNLSPYNLQQTSASPVLFKMFASEGRYLMFFYLYIKINFVRI